MTPATRPPRLKRPAFCGEVEGEQLQHGDLGGVRLGRGDADLGPGPRVEDPVGLAGKERVDDVGERERARPAPARLAQGVEGVDRLARLADGDDEGVLAQHGVAVAELARDLDLGRHLRPVLEGDAAAKTGVVGRAATDEDDAVDLLEIGGREAELLELGRPVRVDPAHEGVAKCPRLLVDLFRHEVVVAVSPGSDDVPAHLERLELARQPVEADDRDGAGPDLGDLVVGELEQGPCRAQQGGDVGGDEPNAVHPPQDEGRGPPRRRDHVRLARAHRRESEVATQLADAAAEGLSEPRARGELALEHVGDDLRVGLGRARVALGLQLVPELLVVLDDAVVGDGDRAGAVEVRMGVVLDSGPVRGPARVAYAGGRRRRGFGGGGTQGVEGMAPHGVALSPKSPVVDEDDAGRVIAAVLEKGQCVQQHRQGLRRAGHPDNSAHTPMLTAIIRPEQALSLV
jgi:hypothetical protein